MSGCVEECAREREREEGRERVRKDTREGESFRTKSSNTVKLLGWGKKFDNLSFSFIIWLQNGSSNEHKRLPENYFALIKPKLMRASQQLALPSILPKRAK